MPRKEIDYSKCIIYKIVCNDFNITELYVGSTTEFTKRKYRHKSNCANSKQKEYNFKVYEFIRNNGDWDNWSMIEIEKYPCSDGNEARARERYWCETLKASLNDRAPIKIAEPKKARPHIDYSSGPCIYKYPEYYNYCKKQTMQEIIEKNEQYYKLKNKLE